MWLWLNKCPSLPPVCVGRAGGSTPYVIQQVHDLGDTKTIKSYLLLIWSEWDCLYLRWGKSHSSLLDYVYLVPEEDRFYKRGPPEMCTLIKKNFGEVEMGDHRQDLLQRLNHILGQLDLGLNYLQQHKPSLSEDDIQQMKGQYGELKEVLLELDREVTILI